MSLTPVFKAMMIPAAVASMVLLGGVAGCAATAAAVGADASAAKLPPVVLTQADSGKTVRLRPGQELRLSLPSNPSTGYGWTLTRQPANLESLGPEAYAPSADGAPMPGRGGHTSWRLRASKPGTDRLSLIYHQPWATGVKPADTFECQVSVE